MNVPNAYLKEKLKKIIYMKLSKGYESAISQQINQSNKRKRDRVLRLLRPLYGLKQSGREWNLKAKKQFETMGFRSINSDLCVFFNKSEQTVFALYVDDLLIFSQSTKNISKVKKQLFEKFRMKNMGKAFFILNIRIRRNKAKKFLITDQTVYIKKFLQKYDMEDAHSVTTPIDEYSSLISFDATESRINQREYQKRIDSLMYAIIATRPDIAYAEGKLSQYCQNSAAKHRAVLDQIFRYLKRTTDLALLYDNSVGSISYADASYGDDVSDRKSTYGNTLLIENAAVTRTSKKQQTVASSIVEAEYVFMCQTGKNIV